MSRAAWSALDAYPNRRPSQREAWQAGLDGEVADGAAPLDACKSGPRIVRRQVAFMECMECGHQFVRSAKRIRISGERCPGCGGYDTEVS